MTLMLPRISDLDGTLWRGDAGWYWLDGCFEPRVRDLWLEELAPDWPRVRQGRVAWIEIPTEWRTQISDPELVRAVTELIRQYADIGPIRDTGAAAVIGARGHQRSGYRVPETAWRIIMREPCGATWSQADDTAVRSYARTQVDLK